MVFGSVYSERYLQTSCKNACESLKYNPCRICAGLTLTFKIFEYWFWLSCERQRLKYSGKVQINYIKLYLGGTLDSRVQNPKIKTISELYQKIKTSDPPEKSAVLWREKAKMQLLEEQCHIVSLAYNLIFSKIRGQWQDVSLKPRSETHRIIALSFHNSEFWSLCAE